MKVNYLTFQQSNYETLCNNRGNYQLDNKNETIIKRSPFTS